MLGELVLGTESLSESGMAHRRTVDDQIRCAILVEIAAALKSSILGAVEWSSRVGRPHGGERIHGALARKAEAPWYHISFRYCISDASWHMTR